MEDLNHTAFTEFIFLRITDNFQVKVLLSVTFIIIYLFTLLGNTSISALIWTDPQLQTPMYFFLSNLACSDLCCSSAITPKIVDIILSEKKGISFAGCATQLFLLALFGGCELFLLSVMAYDRYVAICNPLLYPVIINHILCVHLVCATYLISVLNAIIQVTLTFNLTFCKSNVIDHLFCDLPPLLKLSCSDTSLNKLGILVVAFLFGMGTCSVIVISYSFIIATILKIPSVKGRYKTFSTCGSHFTMVSLYYGAIFIMYLQPTSNSLAHKNVVSLFYSVLIPMLNPLIYSFRNKDVKKSIEKYIFKLVRR